MNFLHWKGHVSPRSQLIDESESCHRLEECREMQSSTDVDRAVRKERRGDTRWSLTHRNY